jgi:hypothetical protein
MKAKPQWDTTSHTMSGYYQPPPKKTVYWQRYGEIGTFVHYW